jgi:predicted ABC-class ATPase
MPTDIPERPRHIRAGGLDVSGAAQAETPSQQIIARTVRPPVTVTDDLGRQLTVRKIGMVDQMRIRRVLGADLSKNEPYLALATLAFCITEIDGERVIPPANVREIEFLVDKLGEEGAVAIGRVYADEGWAKIDPGAPQGFDLEVAKN